MIWILYLCLALVKDYYLIKTEENIVPITSFLLAIFTKALLFDLAKMQRNTMPGLCQ